MLWKNAVPCKLLEHYYKTKYPQDNIDNVKKALCESEKINPYEWYIIKMIKNDIELVSIPQLLKNEVKKYDLLCDR